MPLQVTIQPGGQKWKSLALQKLAQMKDYMRRNKLHVLSRWYQPSGTDRFFVQSCVGFDRIRIFSAPLGGTLFELIDPELLVPDIDTALLDLASDNFGLVLPAVSPKDDTAFNTALLLNPSFSRQLPSDYADISEYLVGSNVVYLPDLNFGTAVFARFALDGDPLMPDGGVAMCWVSNIRHKSGSPAFIGYAAGPGLDPATDFLLNVDIQTGRSPGTIAIILNPFFAIGADGAVTIAYLLTDDISNLAIQAISYLPGVGSSVAVTMDPGSLSLAGAAVCRRGTQHCLAVGLYDSTTAYLTGHGGISFSDAVPVVVTSNNEFIYPDVMLARGTRFAVAFVWLTGAGFFYKIYLRGTTASYAPDYAAFGLANGTGLVAEHGVDISVVDVPAAVTAFRTNAGAASYFVQVGSALINRSAGGTALLTLRKTIAGAWTPDGRYFYAARTSGAIIFNAVGSIIYESAGAVTLSDVRLFQINQIGGAVETAAGTVRTYEVLIVNASNARTGQFSVREVGGVAVEVLISGADTPVVRFWPAAVPGGVDDTRRVVL